MLLKKIFLPTILFFLCYGFYLSQNFIQIAFGVALFLFGMMSLEQGFKSFTGGLFEKILKGATSTLARSLSFGVVSTTLMQSSSLVSIITISFLSAGLISLAAGIGIIFGSNLGTTTGAWLIAGFGLKINISSYAMPMFIVGLVFLLQKNPILKGVGYIFSGMGFIFLGIFYMKEGFEAFKESIDLMAYAVDGLIGLFIFTVIGIFATVIMQSSHATLVLIITALAASQITYENALALAIGANIGTTITAILGSISSNIQGKRLALAHLVFNFTTGFIAIIFISPLIWLVDHLSEVIGILPDDYTLKLALFHTIFNLIGIVVMTPFINPLVVFLENTLKAKRKIYAAPKYLNDDAVQFPETLLKAVQNETIHLYKISETYILKALHLPLDILDAQNIEKAVLKNQYTTNKHLKDEFKSHIVPLSTAIVDYVAKNGSIASYAQFQYLYELGKVSNQIIAITKDAKHLSKRMAKAIQSKNPILKEYNLIRIHIAYALKEISDLLDNNNLSSPSLALDKLLVEFSKENEKASLRHAQAINSGELTSENVIMINTDRGYEKDILEGLAFIGSRLSDQFDADNLNAEKMLSLSTEDIKEIKTPQTV